VEVERLPQRAAQEVILNHLRLRLEAGGGIGLPRLVIVHPLLDEPGGRELAQVAGDEAGDAELRPLQDMGHFMGKKRLAGRRPLGEVRHQVAGEIDGAAHRDRIRRRAAQRHRRDVVEAVALADPDAAIVDPLAEDAPHERDLTGRQSPDPVRHPPRPFVLSLSKDCLLRPTSRAREGQGFDRLGPNGFRVLFGVRAARVRAC
jgi:hypothetical protein